MCVSVGAVCKCTGVENKQVSRNVCKSDITIHSGATLVLENSARERCTLTVTVPNPPGRAVGSLLLSWLSQIATSIVKPLLTPYLSTFFRGTHIHVQTRFADGQNRQRD